MFLSARQGRVRRVLFLLCALCALQLLLFPRPATEAVAQALQLCADTIIPSLFPFLALSALLTALFPTGAASAPPLAKLSRTLFRVRPAGLLVLALGFTGGYPVGVRTAAAFYSAGRLSRAETLRLLAFCNNSGPGFLLGVVGLGVFHSSAVGLALYAVHIASALLAGLLFRFYAPQEAPCRSRSTAAPEGNPPSLSALFTAAVTSSFTAVLQICAFVLFFMVVLRMLAVSGILALLCTALTYLLAPLGMTEQLSCALLAGFLELSTGSACLRGAALSPLTAALSAFLLGWGGLSVHCQSLLFLQAAHLPCRTYLCGKLLQGLLSAVLAAALFSRFCP